MNIKKRKERLKDYDEKYSEVPKDYRERLQYLFNKIGYNQDDIARIYNKAQEILDNIEYEYMTFILYEEAIPYMRARERFHTPLAKENSSFIKKFINELYGDIKLIVTPSDISIDIYVRTLASMKKDELVLAELGVITPMNRPDVDNIMKGYLDAFIDNIIIDDAIFKDCRARKFYSIKPRLEFTIKYQKNFETEFNLKKLKSNKKYKDLLVSGRV